MHVIFVACLLCQEKQGNVMTIRPQSIDLLLVYRQTNLNKYALQPIIQLFFFLKKEDINV